MPSFKYRQIIEDVITQIEKDQLQGKLSSVRALAKSQGVGVSTVAHAYHELERLGWIEAKPKVGYFVRKQRRVTQPDHSQKIYYGKASLTLDRAVHYSFNDPDILPLSCTAPSSLIDNEALLNRLHKKALTHRPYRLLMQDPLAGVYSLRCEIARDLQKSNQVVSPEQIVITNGRVDGLMIALMANQALSGAIAIESPVCFYFQSALKRLNAKIIAIPMQAHYQDELDLLSQAYQAQPFKVYLLNPNFADPTGRVLTNAEKQALIQWATAHEVTLIEYDRGELHFGGERPCSISCLVEADSNCQVITLCDFYDTISPTLNLGYLICSNSVESCLFYKQVICEESSLTQQYMLLELMRTKEYDKLIRRLHAELKTAHDSALNLLLPYFNQIESDDFYYSHVTGGPCLWIKLPAPLTSEALWQQAISAGLSLAPGDMFSFDQAYPQYFRITFALPWNAKMIEGIKQLGALILAYTLTNKLSDK